MAKHATIEDYVAALPPHLRATAEAARRVIDGRFPPQAGAIRWAHPTWSIGKTPVCYLKAASQHITFGCWQGASLDDPSGRLTSTGQVMAHAKLRGPEDVDKPLFEHWLRQAIELAARV